MNSKEDNREQAPCVIVPAHPGDYVIDLVPLPGGGFDNQKIMREPVLAWRVYPSGYSEPVIPGNPVSGRWAVLTIDGYVITDELTAVGLGNTPLTLQAWVKAEIAWVTPDANDSLDFLTPSQNLFCTRGPVPNAIWQMMQPICVWSGTFKELLEALLPFKDNHADPDWPDDVADFRLKLMSTDMAAVGIRFELIGENQVHLQRSEGDVVEITGAAGS